MAQIMQRWIYQSLVDEIFCLSKSMFIAIDYILDVPIDCELLFSWVRVKSNAAVVEMCKMQ